MVTSSVRSVSVERVVHQMIILESTWNVTPSIVTPENPDVMASVRVYYKEPGLPEVGVMGAPVVAHVTRPDGTTFDTPQAVTDPLGDVSWIITLDQIGTWSFTAEAFSFVTNGEEYLGCEKPLTQLQMPITPLLAIALISSPLALAGLLLVL